MSSTPMRTPARVEGVHHPTNGGDQAVMQPSRSPPVVLPGSPTPHPPPSEPSTAPRPRHNSASLAPETPPPRQHQQQQPASTSIAAAGWSASSVPMFATSTSPASPQPAVGGSGASAAANLKALMANLSRPAAPPRPSPAPAAPVVATLAGTTSVAPAPQPAPTTSSTLAAPRRAPPSTMTTSPVVNFAPGGSATVSEVPNLSDSSGAAPPPDSRRPTIVPAPATDSKEASTSGNRAVTPAWTLTSSTSLSARSRSDMTASSAPSAGNDPLTPQQTVVEQQQTPPQQLPQQRKPEPPLPPVDELPPAAAVPHQPAAVTRTDSRGSELKSPPGSMSVRFAEQEQDTPAAPMFPTTAETATTAAGKPPSALRSTPTQPSDHGSAAAEHPHPHVASASVLVPAARGGSRLLRGANTAAATGDAAGTSGTVAIRAGEAFPAFLERAMAAYASVVETDTDAVNPHTPVSPSSSPPSKEKEQAAAAATAWESFTRRGIDVVLGDIVQLAYGGQTELPSHVVLQKVQLGQGGDTDPLGSSTESMSSSAAFGDADPTRRAKRSSPVPFVSCLAMRQLALCPAARLEFSAAALFIDLSGYSAAAAVLSARNPYLLSNAVNEYLGRILAVVKRAGGDVVKFAGDAVIALWHGDDDEIIAEAEKTIPEAVQSHDMSIRAAKSLGQDDDDVSPPAKDADVESADDTEESPGTLQTQVSLIEGPNGILRMGSHPNSPTAERRQSNGSSPSPPPRTTASGRKGKKKQAKRRSSSLADQCLAACACACEIMQSCSEYTVFTHDDKMVTFGLHIGGACGVVSSRILLPPEVRRSTSAMPAAFHFVAGKPLEEAAEACNTASRGELIITERMRSLADDGLRATHTCTRTDGGNGQHQPAAAGSGGAPVRARSGSRTGGVDDVSPTSIASTNPSPGVFATGHHRPTPHQHALRFDEVFDFDPLRFDTNNNNATPAAKVVRPQSPATTDRQSPPVARTGSPTTATAGSAPTPGTAQQAVTASSSAGTVHEPVINFSLGAVDGNVIPQVPSESVSASESQNTHVNPHALDNTSPGQPSNLPPRLALEEKSVPSLIDVHPVKAEANDTARAVSPSSPLAHSTPMLLFNTVTKPYKADLDRFFLARPHRPTESNFGRLLFRRQGNALSSVVTSYQGLLRSMEATAAEASSGPQQQQQQQQSSWAPKGKQGAVPDELLFVPPRVAEQLAIGVDPLMMAQMRDLVVLFVHIGDPPTSLASASTNQIPQGLTNGHNGGSGPQRNVSFSSSTAKGVPMAGASDPNLIDPAVWFFEVHATLSEFGCAIIQLIDDDKGIHVVAAFNLYTISDDAGDRCVETLLRLRERSPRTIVGAAAGNVFCGVLGSKASCQWDITGAACVRACRLMQHGVKERLACVLDESVFALTTDRSPLRSVRPLSVKGSPQPVQAYTLQPPSHRRSTLGAGGLARNSKSSVFSASQGLSLAPAQGNGELARSDAGSRSTPRLHFANTLSRYVHVEAVAELRKVVEGQAASRVAILIGPVATGKFSAALNAVDQARSVPVVHTCEESHLEETLMLLKSLSAWFSASVSSQVARAAELVETQLASGHRSNAFVAGVELMKVVATRGARRICIIIRRSQFLDAASITFLNAAARAVGHCPLIAFILTCSPLLDVPNSLSAFGYSTVSNEMIATTKASTAATSGAAPDIGPAAILPLGAAAQDAAMASLSYNGLGGGMGDSLSLMESIRPTIIEMETLKSDDEKRALVCHVLESRCDAKLVDLVSTMSYGYVGWIVALCEYLSSNSLVHVASSGKMALRPGVDRAVKLLSWTEIAPKITVRVMQLVDHLAPSLLMMCKIVAAITEQPGISAFYYSVNRVTQVMLGRDLDQSDIQSMQSVYLLRECEHKCTAHTGNGELDAAMFYVPPMRDVVAGMLTPQQRSKINRVAAGCYADTHPMNHPMQYLVRARHELFSDDMQEYAHDMATGWRMIVSKPDLSEAERARLKGVYVEWIARGDWTPVDLAAFVSEADMREYQGALSKAKRSLKRIVSAMRGGYGMRGTEGRAAKSQSMRQASVSAALAQDYGDTSGSAGGDSGAATRTVDVLARVEGVPRPLCLGPAREFLSTTITELRLLSEALLDAEVRVRGDNAAPGQSMRASLMGSDTGGDQPFHNDNRPVVAVPIVHRARNALMDYARILQHSVRSVSALDSLHEVIAAEHREADAKLMNIVSNAIDEIHELTSHSGPLHALLVDDSIVRDPASEAGFVRAQGHVRRLFEAVLSHATTTVQQLGRQLQSRDPVSVVRAATLLAEEVSVRDVGASHGNVKAYHISRLDEAQRSNTDGVADGLLWALDNLASRNAGSDVSTLVVLYSQMPQILDSYAPTSGKLRDAFVEGTRAFYQGLLSMEEQHQTVRAHFITFLSLWTNCCAEAALFM